MTKSDTADWIRNNLPTEIVEGEEMVRVDHDTDGDTKCSICGRPHTPSVEYHTVDSLADQYYESMDTHLPDQAADVAQEAVAEAQNRGTGHERYFEQYFDS